MSAQAEHEERRRPTPETPLGYLEQLPALVLLERLPVPVLAVESDGTVVHANSAFEELLGYPVASLRGHPVSELLALDDAPTGADAVEHLRESDTAPVDLTHQDGSRVRALVSRPILRREDDPVTLVCFHDVTEQLWNGGRAPGF
ncbi:PAS domain-containing protein [Rhodococcus opacus]|uniref:PAS domain-containing protein n=1 Tax=Rhodococcus opacus TaxID=37919 RepID=UPI0022361A2F|nr:PAS domain-containing protein [Rhodococcus opacus]UZG57240.1 PAS domain-containing protein [Rhodococcus opacus]